VPSRGRRRERTDQPDRTTTRRDRADRTIVGPAAQIEITSMMPEWVPGLRRRDKDAQDIARLRAALPAVSRP